MCERVPASRSLRSINVRMQKTIPETAADSAERLQPILAWKVHLLREQPVKLLLIVPVVLLGLVVSYVMFQTPVFALVALVLFTSALAEYLFPVRYEIDARGASSRTLVGRTRIEWDRVRKYYLDDHGIKLSPLSGGSRLEAYRGVYLRFGDRREEVVEAVRTMRDAATTGDSAAAGTGRRRA